MTDEATERTPDADVPADDRLDQLRTRLETIDELPVEERAAVFQDVNRALVAELDALEEL